MYLIVMKKSSVKQIYFIICCMITFVTSVYSQQFDLGTWNIINVKYSINNKWSTFGEAQLRSLKFYNNFHYYEYKGGASYKLKKNMHVALAAGSYQTYKEEGNFVQPKNNDEFRIWPQIILYQSVGKFLIEQRYRAEFRFTNNGYRNRFRYRLGLSYPFGTEKNGYKPFQINANNEIFFTDKEPYFERNRASISLNYKPNHSSTLQVGYLQQFDYKINDETGRDFLQIGYFIDLLRK